jgi:hypothetical protein
MGYTFSPERGRKRKTPWKESSVRDERMRFVIRLKDGESMASLCREFGISLRMAGLDALDGDAQAQPAGVSVYTWMALLNSTRGSKHNYKPLSM